MMDEPLISHDIGSLAKPPWRVKALTDRELTDDDIDLAKSQGNYLGVDGHDELVELLETGSFDDDAKQQIREWSSIYAIAFLEQHLDVVYDGEQHRTEMYHHAVQHMDGFEFVGNVRSFDNKYYNKAVVREEPTLEAPYHLEELAFVADHATKPLKVPLTGPYTIVDWSFNEAYRTGGFGKTGQADRREARRELLLDVAENVLRPTVEALVDAGAEWIQMDEPAVTTKPDEVDLWVEAFEAVTEGIDAKMSCHICFSDYTALFPDVLELSNCDQLALEFANRDAGEVGVGDDKRPGYADLQLFADHDADLDVGLGVVSIHDDEVETPEVVRDRILHAADLLGADAVNPCPDCGLRTRTWEVADKKLRAIARGTRQAKEKLGFDVKDDDEADEGDELPLAG